MQPRLVTERLSLIPYAKGDWPLWHRIISDPKVIFWQDPPYTEDQTRPTFARSLLLAGEGLGWWAAVPKEAALTSETLLGHIALKPLESKPGAIEVAYHFLVAAQGQGYAAEAARAITRYGFETLGLDEIVATVLPTNAPSQKTIIRAGFTRSGTLMHGGRLHDFFVARREAWLAAQR